MKQLGIVLGGALLSLHACAVDDRELTVAPSGGGGESFEAGAGGVAEPDGSGSVAGESPEGPLGGCADLDTDGEADCRTTLVDNASFAEGVRGWIPGEDATLTWDERDGLDAPPSGSAKLSASTTHASAAQCLELPGRKLVIAYAQVLAEPPEPGKEPSRGLLRVSFYESAACQGEPLGFFETPVSDSQESWSTVQAGALSDEGSRGMAIELSGVKAADASWLTVYFDNVMLKTQELD